MIDAPPPTFLRRAVSSGRTTCALLESVMPGIPPPFSHDPRRSAKQLRKAALAGDPVALGRLRLVFEDLAVANPPSSAMSLRRCQHVIARESGFANWVDMVDGEQKRERSPQRLLVVDEFWNYMYTPQQENIPKIRAMRGVPEESYHIRDDGRIYCASALEHAFRATTEELSQNLIDRLLPDSWRPAGEAVRRWGVPSGPYTIHAVDRDGQVDAAAPTDDWTPTRIKHGPFNAFLPGVYPCVHAYGIVGQLITGRYQAPGGRCSWRGIPLEPIEDVDWRALGNPPIPVDPASLGGNPTDIEPENPLLDAAGQEALDRHHRAWLAALQPYVHRTLEMYRTNGMRLNDLPWDRILRDPDDSYDEEANDVRAWIHGYVPPAIPNHILASSYRDLTHGHIDAETIIWTTLAEQLIGPPVGLSRDFIATRVAQYAVARWLDGLPWEQAAAEARRVGRYDMDLEGIVDRISAANAFITGPHPQPPLVGPPWRSLSEGMVDLFRLGRKHGIAPTMISQQAPRLDWEAGKQS